MIREFADDAPLPDLDQLAEVRAKLMTELEHRRRRRFRLVVPAAVVLVVDGLGGGAPGVTEGRGAPVVSEAAQVLNQAADAARKEPGAAPRPDQFVHSRR